MASNDEEYEKALFSAQKLYLNLLEYFPKIITDFDTKWQTWQQAVATSSEPSAGSVANLTTLGPKILPLVIYKIALEPDNTSAVDVYNALTSTSSNSPATRLEILTTDFHTSRALRNALADWAEHCERVSKHSSVSMYTQCEEYHTLLEFGPTAVPAIMVEWGKSVKAMGNDAGNVGGYGGVVFWYELVHQLVWGEGTGLQSVDLKGQWELWKAWFEGGEGWEGAPRFGARKV